jgi:hypothetical protein
MRPTRLTRRLKNCSNSPALGRCGSHQTLPAHTGKAAKGIHPLAASFILRQSQPRNQPATALPGKRTQRSRIAQLAEFHFLPEQAVVPVKRRLWLSRSTNDRIVRQHQKPLE